jgi:hypothetical protein
VSNYHRLLSSRKQFLPDLSVRCIVALTVPVSAFNPHPPSMGETAMLACVLVPGIWGNCLIPGICLLLVQVSVGPGASWRTICRSAWIRRFLCFERKSHLVLLIKLKEYQYKCRNSDGSVCSVTFVECPLLYPIVQYIISFVKGRETAFQNFCKNQLCEFLQKPRATWKCRKNTRFSFFIYVKKTLFFPNVSFEKFSRKCNFDIFLKVCHNIY